jgi:hypothetical protein
MGRSNATIAMDEGVSESKVEEGEERERHVGFCGGPEFGRPGADLARMGKHRGREGGRRGAGHGARREGLQERPTGGQARLSSGSGDWSEPPAERGGRKRKRGRRAQKGRIRVQKGRVMSHPQGRMTGRRRVFSVRRVGGIEHAVRKKLCFWQKHPSTRGLLPLPPPSILIGGSNVRE